MDMNGYKKSETMSGWDGLEMHNDLRNYLIAMIKTMIKNGYVRYENVGSTAVFKRTDVKNRVKKETVCFIGTKTVGGEQFSVFEQYERETFEIGYVKEVSPYYSVTLTKRGWYSGD